ncbi:hypothetical protein [Methylobacterium sp. NEAU K]|uniref:hypothetical protein n=1 Tax=Methylobacterium sp. NEAU K TaxID=3064946 RepID=UPI002735F8F2|nr:hypothetical protein [Methylobacterium sp. NEAU K]MDP4005048.1 hypothetical protein [Methylobacterium sp. NEAU K]
MTSYSIFVREIDDSEGRPPQLLAYDIGDCREAQSIVSGIAAAYPEHGERPGTGVYWFRFGGNMHEIYAWPHH